MGQRVLRCLRGSTPEVALAVERNRSDVKLNRRAVDDRGGRNMPLHLLQIWSKSTMFAWQQ